jgi:hypothetical protein
VSRRHGRAGFALALTLVLALCGCGTSAARGDAFLARVVPPLLAGAATSSPGSG